jgi:hypothetical protein
MRVVVGRFLTDKVEWVIVGDGVVTVGTQGDCRRRWKCRLYYGYCPTLWSLQSE